MTAVLALAALAGLAGCLFAGIRSGGGDVALLRCFWKIKYATSLTELAVGILGFLVAIVLCTVNGMARFVILFGGMIGIVSDVWMVKTGGWLPTYGTAHRTEKREIRKHG